MCTNGVNTGQLEQMIEQVDDHVKLERRWAHTLGHLAGYAGFATVSEKMHAAQALLDDVRALLGEAKDALEDDAAAASNVTVNLVEGTSMSNDLMRFSVAMPEDLLVRFDRLVARRGLAKNRSEVVRDLVRDALVEEECSTPGAEVMGTLTIVFDHHASDLQEKLHAIQHEYFESIVSSMHVHLDEHNCLEVIVLRGETGLVQDIANLILGTKGVKNGRLVVTTTGQYI